MLLSQLAHCTQHQVWRYGNESNALLRERSVDANARFCNQFVALSIERQSQRGNEEMQVRRVDAQELADDFGDSEVNGLHQIDARGVHRGGLLLLWPGRRLCGQRWLRRRSRLACRPCRRLCGRGRLCARCFPIALALVLGRAGGGGCVGGCIGAGVVVAAAAAAVFLRVARAGPDYLQAGPCLRCPPGRLWRGLLSGGLWQFCLLGLLGLLGRLRCRGSCGCTWRPF